MSERIQSGDRVRHLSEEIGAGTVVSVDMTASPPTAVVDFPRGRMTLPLGYLEGPRREMGDG